MRWSLLFVVAAGLCQAHDPITTKLTFTREISRIFYRHCVSCHHQGGSAPFSLLAYDEARPWAKAIRDEILERRMPPWGPVKGFGEFRNDASLSEVEIAWIVNWVEGGAPEGEEIYLPPAPPWDAKSDAGLDEAVALGAGVTLTREMTALGVEPGGAVQITAERPDGSIVPLAWVRKFSPLQPKRYYFREPLSLAKGTRVNVAGARAAFLLVEPQRRAAATARPKPGP
ncbi:MAG TPA: cytochrome c [Bryobacterales bacterium]|nr:cytochrome c [Bryobacterales bacterium]